MHNPWDLTNIPNTQNELSDQSDERKEQKIKLKLQSRNNVPLRQYDYGIRRTKDVLLLVIHYAAANKQY